jgi:hypothetical protein
VSGGGSRRILLLVLLAGGAVAKLAYDPPIGRGSLDSAFYFQIAHNVAEGRGLTTNVSLYHQGLHPLPRPTNVYPLWPLVLGTVGRFVDLRRVAQGLPEALYVLDLLLIYALANRIARGFGDGADVWFRAGGVELDVGHAAAALLGANPVFFRTTSVPYTEAIAFVCMLGALWAAFRAADTRRLRWAVFAGALAGATYLCRMQLLVVGVGLTAAFALAGQHDRFSRKVALATVGGAAIVCLPWIVFLATWVRDWSLAMFVDFSAYHEAASLAPLTQVVATDSLGALLADRARGLIVAFHPLGEHSYVRSIGPAIYLLPLSLLAALRRPRALWPVAAHHAPRIAVVLAGLGVLASVHLMHMRLWKPWLFGWRHALPVLLLVVVAIAHLRARGRLGSTLAALLVASSLALGVTQIAGEMGVRRRAKPTAAERDLLRWLDARPVPPTVVSTQPQWLSMHGRALWHWTHCSEPSGTTRRLLEVGADFVAVLPGEKRCAFVRDLDDLAVVATFGDDPHRIQLLGRPPAR